MPDPKPSRRRAPPHQCEQAADVARLDTTVATLREELRSLNSRVNKQDSERQEIALRFERFLGALDQFTVNLDTMRTQYGTAAEWYLKNQNIRDDMTNEARRLISEMQADCVKSNRSGLESHLTEQGKLMLANMSLQLNEMFDKRVSLFFSRLKWVISIIIVVSLLIAVLAAHNPEFFKRLLSILSVSSTVSN